MAPWLNNTPWHAKRQRIGQPQSGHVPSLGLSGIVRRFFVCLREAVVQQAQNVNCGIFRAVVLVAMQFSGKLNMALSCELSGIWTVC